MSTQQLPGGLMDSDGEFFAASCQNVHLLTDSVVLTFENFPASVLMLIEKKLLENSIRHKATTEMVASAGRMAELKQLTYCLFGDFDKRPDLLNGELTEPEFWGCPNRGKCAYEGKVCNGFQLPDGTRISGRELEIIQLTAMGFTDKQIAYRLKISKHTVAAHQDNIRIKLNLTGKVAITAFAYQHNLVWLQSA